MKVYGRALRAGAVVSCALALTTPGTAQASDRAPAGTATAALSRITIFNFGQVSRGYYRGSELKGHDAADLAAAGIKLVIDLRSDGDYDPQEAQLVSEAGMRYVRIPMTTHEAPTASQISTFLSLVENVTARPVYVHCVEGRHRTGVMTAIYRMTVDGWTADRAFREMKAYKFGLDFLHPEFKRFVFGYAARAAAAETPGAARTCAPADSCPSL